MTIYLVSFASKDFLNVEILEYKLVDYNVEERTQDLLAMMGLVRVKEIMKTGIHEFLIDVDYKGRDRWTISVRNALYVKIRDQRLNSILS